MAKRRTELVGVFRRIFLLIGILLTLFVAGVLTTWASIALAGHVTGNSAQGGYGMMYVAGTAIFLALSPSLLLPYAIFFWRTRGMVTHSFTIALSCGVLYPLLLIGAIAAASFVLPSLKSGPHESLVAWTIYSAIALIPGVGISLLGAFVGRRLRSRSSAPCRPAATG